MRYIAISALIWAGFAISATAGEVEKPWVDLSLAGDAYFQAVEAAGITTSRRSTPESTFYFIKGDRKKVKVSCRSKDDDAICMIKGTFSFQGGINGKVTVSGNFDGDYACMITSQRSLCF